MSPYRHEQDSSPYRRRSPPKDFHRPSSKGPSTGMQIRGLARESSDGLRRDTHPSYELREHDYYDDHRSQDARYSKERQRGRSRSPNRRSGYQDRDQEGYRSPPREYHERNSSPRRSPRRDRSPLLGAPPSKEIIMEGLPVDITEDHIKKELEQYFNVTKLDDIRIIRDKKTGQSREFGFLRFPDVEASRLFLEQNFPYIYLYGDAAGEKDSQGCKVRIAFSKERENREAQLREGDWKCARCNIVNYSRRTDCIRCGTIKSATTGAADFTHGKPSYFTNTGDSDVSPDSTPSQYLLFRNLEPTVTEEILAKGASKLLKSDDMINAQGKIVSTSTVAHAGANQGTIRRVLLVRDRKTNESWRYGFVEFLTLEDAQAALAKYNSQEKFTISSKPVLVDYVHAGVFVPVLAPTAPATQDFSFSAATNPSLKLSYWDQEAFVTELPVSASEGSQNATSGKSRTKSDLSKATKDGETKSKKRKVEPTANNAAKKSLPTHLQFWTDRHAELHGSEGGPAKDQPVSKEEQNDIVAATEKNLEPSQPSKQSFADPNKHCCYLCSRQFKSSAEANKHERLSDLHQKNLLDDDVRAKAIAKLEKLGLPIVTASQGNDSAYRDRAKERRTAFSQPKQPGHKLPQKPAKGSDAASAPVRSAEKSPSPPPPAKSKGASLLGKMGWNAGQGLGAQGTGSVAPIATDMYAAGVGLGAEGGKLGDAVEEASRSTRGDYAEFAEKTRDRARERYEKIG